MRNIEVDYSHTGKINNKGVLNGNSKLEAVIRFQPNGDLQELLERLKTHRYSPLAAYLREYEGMAYEDKDMWFDVYKAEGQIIRTLKIFCPEIEHKTGNYTIRIVVEASSIVSPNLLLNLALLGQFIEEGEDSITIHPPFNLKGK